MERWREGFHQNGKIYHEDEFSCFIQGKLKLLDATWFLNHTIDAPTIKPTLQD